MPALLTTTQSRWLLSLLVGLLSAIAIASSAPAIAGGESMYSGRPGDIRGMTVVLGCTGLGIIGLSRLAHALLPKPWRVYTDRLEFTSVAMLWICWTSATMSFSSFTLGEGVCSSSSKGVSLPTCPLLTFDLALLHLLSTATLALLLVILSNTLSPNYYTSISNLADEEDDEEGTSISAGDRGRGRGGGVKNGRGSVLVMWELAINSPPSSPRLDPTSSLSGPSRPNGYGATETTTNASHSGPATVRDDTSVIRKRDRFSEGRIIWYSLLLLVSLGVVVGAALLMTMGEYVVSSIFMIVVAISSLAFAITFLCLHRRPISKDESRSLMRSLEVGFAGFLFILWPLAAISFTLFPSIPNRACDNPASSVTPPDPSEVFNSEDSVCLLSFGVISLSWIGAWIVFGRLLGLVFPIPDLGLSSTNQFRVGVLPGRRTGSGSGAGTGEGSSLLGGSGTRPQVGWGRIVAGEAFELGDEDD